jgi:hypothetical protein
MTRRDRIFHALILLSFFVLFSVWSSWAHAQASPDLTFALQTSSTDGKTVVPKLTWSTTPAATSCSASGATDWTGTKAASGTATLAAVNASRTYLLVCNWAGITKAALTWDAPTTYTDGSAYTNPGGYRVQYGNKSAAEVDLTTSDYVNDPAARSWSSPVLAAGTWYFGVKAFSALGLEGPISNVLSKAITADANQQRSLELGIKFPGAPVLK